MKFNRKEISFKQLALHALVFSVLFTPLATTANPANAVVRTCNGMPLVSSYNYSLKNLSGCNLSGLVFTNSKFVNTNMARANLTGTSILNSNITNVNLTGANLKSFRGIGLTGRPIAAPSGYQINEGYLVGPYVNLSHIDNYGQGHNWSGVNFTHANFSFSTFAMSDFRNDNLTFVNLTGANLSGAKLDGADMTGAILSGTTTDIESPPATMSNQYSTYQFFVDNPYSFDPFTRYQLIGPGVVLHHLVADLDLSGRNLSGSTFSSVDQYVDAGLSNVNLSGVNLRNCNFRNVVIEKNSLGGADFTGSQFTAIKAGDGGNSGAPQGMPARWKLVGGWVIGPGAQFGRENGGADLSGLSITNSDLTGTDFSNANLENVDFSGSTLTGATFDEASLGGATFTNVDLRHLKVASGGWFYADSPPALPAGWSLASHYGIYKYFVGPGVDFSGVDFRYWPLDVSGANLSGASFANGRVEFVANGTNFTGVNLSNANIQGDFTNANLSRAKVTGSNLNDSDFSTTAGLSGIVSGSAYGTPKLPPSWRFIGGYLCGPGANLARAVIHGNLSRLDLTGADLHGASVSNSDFTLTNLTRANLIGSVMNGSNLTRTNFTLTNLTGASLRNVILSSTKWNNTVCPDGKRLSNCIGHFPQR